MSDSVIVGNVYNLVGTEHVEPEAGFVKLVNITGPTQHRRYTFDLWS